MKHQKSSIEFPCEFPIKIIGEYHETFYSEIIAIAKQYFPGLGNDAISLHPSKKGNYLSISIQLYVEEKETLDNLYKTLTARSDIKMVL